MRERSMTRAAMVLAMLSGLVAPAGAAEPPGLDTVAAWMTGSFSSAAQAAADPDFRDIRLHVAPIWPEAGGVRWLYVEQAAADRLESWDRGFDAAGVQVWGSEKGPYVFVRDQAGG
jgi:hypothetical protein